MTNSSSKLLLLQGAQPIKEEAHRWEQDYVAYDEQLMITVDIRTRVPIHRAQVVELSDTGLTKVRRETTDDE